MSIRALNAFLLAGVLSIAAASAVQATEGGPTGVGDNNGRSQASNTIGEWHPVLAGDGGPTTVGGNNGRRRRCPKAVRSFSSLHQNRAVLAISGSSGGIGGDCHGACGDSEPNGGMHRRTFKAVRDGNFLTKT
jgi:hypothetical protein